MPSSTACSQSPVPADGRFVLTRWTLIVEARRDDSSAAQEALQTLCASYWQPIYTYVRREGHSPQDAEDLTQEFFARLLAKRFLVDVDRSKGRFRSFLLASLKHFLANEWDKSQAQKRGGRATFISFDTQTAEASLRSDSLQVASAESLFNRRWALTLLDGVLDRLELEYEREGKKHLFEMLKSTLNKDRHSLPYAEIARDLKTSEGAVKVMVHRLRQRFRAMVREEIADTVTTPEEVEDEIRALFAALAG